MTALAPAPADRPRVAAFNDDGTIDLVLMRPAATGPLMASAAVLERDAAAFTDWPLYPPEEAAARAGRGMLPRPPSELAGEVRSARWAPTYQTKRDAELGFERGAVIGRVSPVEWLEQLLRSIPATLRLWVELPPASKTRPARGGTVVERIAPDPEHGHFIVSTRGGRARHGLPLVETPTDRQERENMPDMTLAEALRTPEVIGYLREQLASDQPPRTATGGFLVDDSPMARRLKEKGLNPADFFHTRRPAHGETSDERRRRQLRAVAAAPAAQRAELLEAVNAETPATPRQFLGPDSPVGQRLRAKGIDPSIFTGGPKDAA